MSFLRPFAALALAALVGTSSLLLVAHQQVASLPSETVQQAGGERAIVAISIVQPLVMALIAIAIGLVTAPKLGLRSLLADWVSGVRTRRLADPPNQRPNSFVGVSLVCGLAAGLLIVLGDLLLSPWTNTALSRLSVEPEGRLTALAVGALYGGVTEEIMIRWGLMSLAAWALMRMGIQQRAAVVLGLAIAAILFGLGHLPALAASTPLEPVLITRTMLLNAGAGVLFGIAFFRHSLEAAMAAHALAHVILFIGRVAGVAY